MSEPRIVSLWLSTEFSEKKMLSVPSVTMNGGSLSRVTSRPLIAPIARPHRKPTISARPPGSPAFVVRLAMMTEVKHGDRADRQVDARGQDHQRLTQCQHGDDGDLLGARARGWPPRGTGR